MKSNVDKRFKEDQLDLDSYYSSLSSIINTLYTTLNQENTITISHKIISLLQNKSLLSLPNILNSLSLALPILFPTKNYPISISVIFNNLLDLLNHSLDNFNSNSWDLELNYFILSISNLSTNQLLLNYPYILNDNTINGSTTDSDKSIENDANLDNEFQNSLIPDSQPFGDYMSDQESICFTQPLSLQYLPDTPADVDLVNMNDSNYMELSTPNNSNSLDLSTSIEPTSLDNVKPSDSNDHFDSFRQNTNDEMDSPVLNTDEPDLLIDNNTKNIGVLNSHSMDENSCNLLQTLQTYENMFQTLKSQIIQQSHQPEIKSLKQYINTLKAEFNQTRSDLMIENQANYIAFQSLLETLQDIYQDEMKNIHSVRRTVVTPGLIENMDSQHDRSLAPRPPLDEPLNPQPDHSVTPRPFHPGPIPSSYDPSLHQDQSCQLEQLQLQIDLLQKENTAKDGLVSELQDRLLESSTVDMGMDGDSNGLERWDAEINDLKQGLNTKDAEVTELKQVLHAKDLEVSELKGILHAKDIELIELNHAKDSELSGLKEVLQTKDSEMTELKDDLSAKDAELTEFKGVLHIKDSEVADLKVILHAKVTEVTELKEILNTKDLEVTELKDVVSIKDSEVDELKGALESKDAEVTELKEILHEKDSELTYLKGIVNAKNAELAEMVATLNTKDSELTSLNNLLEAHDLKLSEMASALSAKELQLSELNSVLKVKEVQLEELSLAKDVEISNLNSTIIAKDLELKTIVSSKQPELQISQQSETDPDMQMEVMNEESNQVKSENEMKYKFESQESIVTQPESDSIQPKYELISEIQTQSSISNEFEELETMCTKIDLEWKQKYTTLTQQTTLLQNQLTQSQSRIQQLQADLIHRDQIINDKLQLEMELTTYLSERCAKIQELEGSNIEMQSLFDQIKLHHAYLQSQVARVSQLETTVNDTQTENERLIATVEQSKKDMQQVVDDMNEQRLLHEGRVGEMQGQIDEGTLERVSLTDTVVALERDLADRQLTCDRLQVEMDQFELLSKEQLEIITKLEVELKTGVSDMETVREELVEVRGQHDSVISQLDSARLRISELESDLKRVQNDLDERVLVHQQLLETHTALEADLVTVRAELATAVEELGLVRSTNLESIEQIRILEDHCQQYKTESETLVNQKMELETQLTGVQDEILMLQNHVETVKAELKVKDDSVCEMEVARDTALTELVGLRGRMDELLVDIETIRGDLNICREENTELVRMRSTLDDQIVAKDAAAVVLQTRVDELETNEVAIQGDLGRRVNEVDVLTADLAAVREQCSALVLAVDAAVSERQSVVDTFESRISQMSASMDDRDQQLELLKSENSTLQSQLDELNATIQTHEQDMLLLQASKTVLEEQLVIMKNEVVEWQNKNDELLSQVSTAQHDLETKTKECTTYCDQLQAQTEQCTELKAQYQQVDTLHSALQTQLNALQIDMNVQTETIQVLKKEIENKNEIIKFNESEYHTLNEMFEGRVTEMDALLVQTKQLQDENSKYVEQLGKYRDDIQQLNNTLSERERVLNETMVEKIAQDDKLRLGEESIMKMRSELEAVHAQLDGYRCELEEVKVKIAERDLEIQRLESLDKERQQMLLDVTSKSQQLIDVLEKEKDDAVRRHASIIEETEQLKVSKNKVENDLKTMEIELNGLRKVRLDGQAQNSALAKQINVLRQEITLLRGQETLINLGQDVDPVHVIVPPIARKRKPLNSNANANLNIIPEHQSPPPPTETIVKKEQKRNRTRKRRESMLLDTNGEQGMDLLVYALDVDMEVENQTPTKSEQGIEGLTISLLLMI
ncbi:hypothetical protein BC833DRAFT_595866 [Globomyces pollinis-pini]|nr:hypothetical protein BC833DRAFT_595866 [Globomyces pollinis-pini]